MNLLCTLPVIVIDHLGFSAAGFGNLLALLDARMKAKKKSFVKLTGFGRYQGTREQLARNMESLLESHPQCVIFGTDLPSTHAAVPFREEDDVRLVLDAIERVSRCRSGADAEELIEKVFWSNAESLYQRRLL